MKIDYQHAVALGAIVLPVVATTLASRFSPGSIGALVVVVLGAVGLALKASISQGANVAAVEKAALDEVVK